jgi:hypothetical protein
MRNRNELLNISYISLRLSSIYPLCRGYWNGECEQSKGPRSQVTSTAPDHKPFLPRIQNMIKRGANMGNGCIERMEIKMNEVMIIGRDNFRIVQTKSRAVIVLSRSLQFRP